MVEQLSLLVWVLDTWKLHTYYRSPLKGGSNQAVENVLSPVDLRCIPNAMSARPVHIFDYPRTLQTHLDGTQLPDRQNSSGRIRPGSCGQPVEASCISLVSISPVEEPSRFLRPFLSVVVKADIQV